MLSAIITKVSGLSLEQFLNIYLFYPMEIFEAQWELSPEKLTAGGMGLSLYPKSLVKIAQMLLQDGIYKGRQFIAKEYLKMAATPQIIKQEKRDRLDCEYCGSGYGFQFHIGKDGYYRMDGAFGQLCLLCPDKKRAVIVFSQYARMEDLLSLVYKHLLNDTEGCGDISDNGRTTKKLFHQKQKSHPASSGCKKITRVLRLLNLSPRVMNICWPYITRHAPIPSAFPCYMKPAGQ